MYNHAPRLTRHYDDISGGLQEWCDLSERFIVAEHDPDSGCAKTHVHIGMWNVRLQDEALKRRFRSKTGINMSGNKDWAWDHKEHPDGLPNWEEHVRLPEMIVPTKNSMEIFNYLKYLIKGDLSRVKLVKNIPNDLLEAAKEAWVDSVKNDNSPAVILVEKKRIQLPPYQQTVMNDASVKWYEYKKQCRENDELPLDSQVMEFVCDAMLKCSRGINPHMVRDLSYGVLYSDGEYKDLILQKVRKFF